MSQMAMIACEIDELIRKDYTVKEIAEELDLPISLVADYYHQEQYQRVQAAFEQDLARRM